VETTELDTLLEELEIRMERLRSLYEQYFMGIEKLEPSIARKDVDRRIWALRKEQIRNTGRRFKFNVLVQRYNTFQQYWIRICREIENGTYARHLARLKRSGDAQALLTIAARRRAGLFHRMEEAQAEEAPDTEPPPATEPPPDPGLDPLDDIRRAIDDALGASQAPPDTDDLASPAPEPIPRAPRLPGPGKGISAFDLELDEGLATLPPPRQSVAPTLLEGRPRRPSTPAAPSSRPPLPSGRPVPPPQSRLSQAQRSHAPDAPGPQSSPLPPPPVPRPPAPPRPSPAVPAALPIPASTVTAQRVKELHALLAEAKRQTNDPAAVSEAALTRSLQAAEAKLRQRHGADRDIDFDVVIKDGRAVVKPVVR
jgi:hypothetical protein